MSPDNDSHSLTAPDVRCKVHKHISLLHAHISKFSFRGIIFIFHSLFVPHTHMHTPLFHRTLYCSGMLCLHSWCWPRSVFYSLRCLLCVTDSYFIGPTMVRSPANAAAPCLKLSDVCWIYMGRTQWPGDSRLV